MPALKRIETVSGSMVVAKNLRTARAAGEQRLHGREDEQREQRADQKPPDHHPADRLARRLLMAALFRIPVAGAIP